MTPPFSPSRGIIYTAPPASNPTDETETAEGREPSTVETTRWPATAHADD